MAVGTGIEMAMAIPGFAAEFDVEDLLKAAAPRPFLIVSAEDDPHAADAADVERLARPAYEAHRAADQLQHLGVAGTHPLDAARFEAILAWFTARHVGHMGILRELTDGATGVDG